MRNLIMNTVKEAKSLVARIEEKQGGISILISSSIDQNNLVMLYLPYRAHIGNVLVYPYGESHNYITFEIDWYKTQIKNATNGFDIEVHNYENTSIHCLLKVRLSGCVFEGQRNIEHKNVAESFAFNRPYFPPFKIFIAGKEDSSLYNKKQIFEIILKRFPEFEPCILTNPAGFDPDLSLKYVAESDCLLFLFEPTSNWSYTEYKYAMDCNKKVFFVTHDKIIQNDMLAFFDHYPAPQEEISYFTDDNYVSLLNEWMNTLATVRKQNFSKEQNNKTVSAIPANINNAETRSDAVSAESKEASSNKGHDVTKTETKQCLFTKKIQEYVCKNLLHGSIDHWKQLPGLSGSQVFLVEGTSNVDHQSGWHIIKLSETNDENEECKNEESRKYQMIKDDAPNAFKKHLVKSHVVYHEGLQIIRSDHGLLTYSNSTNLCNLPLDEKCVCAKNISHDLLSKWNSASSRAKSNGDVSSFFSTLLRKRIAKNGKFSQLIEILLDDPQARVVRFPFTTEEYPNPYYYITNLDVLATIINNHGEVKFISGKTHGDFHAENVICDTSGVANYAIIDYSDYEIDSFVLYDNAVLEVDNYYRFLKDETPYKWQHQLRLLDEKFTNILDANLQKYVNYKSELLHFRNAVCEGISTWITDLFSGDSERIELQFTCARIAAGVKAFCSIGKKKQNLQGQDDVRTVAVTEMSRSPPIENFEECVLMFYYTAICLKRLFELPRVSYYEWHSAKTVANLNVEYLRNSSGFYQLIWPLKQ
jgi:hypothetical protein